VVEPYTARSQRGHLLGQSCRCWVIYG